MAQPDGEFAPLTTVLVKQLTDKLYEKRKGAALEIEKLVRQYVQDGDDKMIRQTLHVIGTSFALSDNQNYRKGGLISLAASAIALGHKDIEPYILLILKPILPCFSDNDGNVRYYACEALYNVVKVARTSALPHFPDIFDVLSKLCADSHQNTRNGSELLDRLMKDIVTEDPNNFDVGLIIPLIREKIYSRNPYVREFLVAWLSTLDSVPAINLLSYLPDLLDGLLLILTDPRAELRKQCETVLGEFLHSIVQRSDVAFPKMINILIVHAQNSDDLLQFTALMWLKQFFIQAGPQLLPCTSALDTEKKRDVRETARQVNAVLVPLVPKLPMEANVPLDQDDESRVESLNLASVVDVLVRHLEVGAVATRIACLQWISELLKRIPRHLFKYCPAPVLPVLMRSLGDVSEEVVLLDLELLAEMSRVADALSKNERGRESSYFRFILDSILSMFESDADRVRMRDGAIIRQLCTLMSPEAIYTTIAEILANYGEDPVDEDISGAGAASTGKIRSFTKHRFIASLVHTLHTLLMTAAELCDLRNVLKGSDDSRGGIALFTRLYRCWCFNEIAAVGLCLLTHNYRLACDLVELLASGEAGHTVDVETLAEIDRLIQLIESPIFTHLRLELLSSTPSSAALTRALCGILMLLPQTDAFHTLRQRLQCASLVSAIPTTFAAVRPATSDAAIASGAAQYAEPSASSKKKAKKEKGNDSADNRQSNDVAPTLKRVDEHEALLHQFRRVAERKAASASAAGVIQAAPALGVSSLSLN